MAQAVCLNCEDEFSYSPSKKKGKYCSNNCFQEARKKEKLALWLTGALMSDRTAKTLLLYTAPFCEECGVGQEWNGKPLSLQLDHVNGDSEWNHISNCRLLCPNCHSQTDTFGSKNIGAASRKPRHKKQKEPSS